MSFSASPRIPGLAALLLTLFLPLPAHTQATPQQARTAQFLRGRNVPGTNPAAALDLARQQHQALLAQPRASNLTATWTSVGPNQVATTQYGNVTGRITAIVIDPADPTGNTVYLGTTGGGIWKSTNAAGPASAVTFSPLTDTLSVFSTASQTTPSLSIGSLAISNGVLLAGTGDPNDATDSYYGAGILRSPDGGNTWTLAQTSIDLPATNHSLFGLSVAGLAFSSLNPSLAVAAVSQSAQASLVNAVTTASSQMGLYYSTDAGLTWHMGTLVDGSQTIQSPLTASNNNGGNAATSVVWNPIRQTFYAAVRYHGYYQSSDGITWTRLTTQPATSLTTTACPPNPANVGSAACPIFRGTLAVQPTTGDTFALTVDSANRNQGLYQDTCALTGTTCSTASVSFGTQLNATPLQSTATTVIPQADYNLTLAAAPLGTDTVLYAGTIDLYRCTLAAGCTLRNTTNAQDGCTNSALVAPAQHAIAVTSNALLYLGNDGGLWRSTDGVAQTGQPCSLTDATHLQNLNSALGSLAEVVSFAQSPTSSTTLLAGLGALGTAGTSTVTKSWPQLSSGEGGTVAMDPTTPSNWYLSTGAGINLALCNAGSNCTTTLAAAQVANDVAAIHAPWLLDPALSTNLVAGTCRVWRGSATTAALWSSANAISAPFSTPAASACSATAPVVRSLAAGGSATTAANLQNTGSRVLYAGLAGTLDGGQTLGGHLFVTTSADQTSPTTAWTDAATSPVTNDTTDANRFNPGGFDISSIAVDPHDATGATVYATVMGFTANGINALRLYRSTDAGAHWTNISANLPSAPANSVVVDPNDANTLYVALDTGVYVTTAVTTCTTASCWSVYGSALPYAPIVQLQAAANMPTGDGRLGELRAATYGRGIWQIPLLTAATPVAPAIAINPSTVTYSPQQTGTSSQPVTITVTNTGTAPLTVSSVTTTGDFSQTNNCTSAAIVQSATCTIQLTFLPTATGTRTGLLTVYGNVPGGQATATLGGTATAAATVVLTPTALTFPSTSVGATSPVQSITISNTGGSTTTLHTPVITGDFAITTNTCGTSLAPGVGCTLSIQFAPTASGSRSGTLTITDGAGTQTATLTGTATNPATDTLTPTTLTFAAQQLNTTSASQQVTLTNLGDVALTLISTQITAGDFLAVNNCGTSLAPHSICSITVTFSPKSLPTQTGTLAITDQYRTQTVTLTGSGLAPPGVSLAPTSGLAFAATGVGLSTSAQTITLTNNGGVTLSLTSITVSGDYAILSGSNTCASTLAPAAVCTLQIVFTPTATGARTGTVTFSDSAPNSPQTLPLSGTGIDFSLTANGPTTLTIASGQTATYALLLTSAAGLPGTATFTCAGLPTHATCTVNPASTALGATTNISVTIATGVAVAQLTPPHAPQLIWLALLVPLGLLIRRKPRAIPLLLLAAITGCSASRTIPTSTTTTLTTVVTPSGTSSIVVAASSAGLVRSVNLTLTVQ